MAALFCFVFFLMSLSEEFETPPLSKISNESKTLVGDLYGAWNELGYKADLFVKLFETAGYDVSLRSLRRWKCNSKLLGDALPGGAPRGAKKILSEAEQRLVVGFVLFENDSHREVNLASLTAFILDSFKKDMSSPSVQRLMIEQGFSSRVMQIKTSGYKLDRSTLVEMAFDWLVAAKITSHIWSVDYTFTGHRQDRRTSYSLKGGTPPKSGVGCSRFTNAIITAGKSDGTYYAPIAYTYNAAFRRDRPSTPKRDAEVAHLDAVLKKYKIDPGRVVYVGNDKKETRVYVSESAELVKKYFEEFIIADDAEIISDAGRAFKDALVPLGFSNHRVYPGPVHHFLSMNDNRWHGAAKTKWRALDIDFSDDVEATISLLWCLEETAHGIRKWFEQNLQIGSTEIDKEKVELLILGKKVIDDGYYQDCLFEYKLAAGLDARRNYSSPVPDLLDGRFWQK